VHTTAADYLWERDAYKRDPRPHTHKSWTQLLPVQSCQSGLLASSVQAPPHAAGPKFYRHLQILVSPPPYFPHQSPNKRTTFSASHQDKFLMTSTFATTRENTVRIKFSGKPHCCRDISLYLDLNVKRLIPFILCSTMNCDLFHRMELRHRELCGLDFMREWICRRVCKIDKIYFAFTVLIRT
jgi:hypothetical protein